MSVYFHDEKTSEFDKYVMESVDGIPKRNLKSQRKQFG